MTESIEDTQLKMIGAAEQLALINDFRNRSPRTETAGVAPHGWLPGPKPPHRSPCFNNSCIASRESSPIAWPALFNNRACRPCALATAAANACSSGSGMQVSRISARLSTSANKACCDRSRRVISRLISSRLVASRSSAPMIASSRPLNSRSIAALRKTLGLA